jgi:hypothetical protein
MPNINMPNIKMPSMPKLSGALADPWPFMAVWVIGGILSIVVPVLKWNANKQDYYDSYGYAVEYEQQQRAYEEQQNGGNNNNNNYYYYPQCHWWQYKCRVKAFNYRQNADGNNNDNGEYQLQYPGWFIFFGGETEEDQRWKEEQGEFGESSGASKFVYAWSIVMFVTIILYGCFVLYTKRAVGPIVIMLCMFLQFSIMAMILLCQGVIDTDERDLEDTIYGFFGQMGVLMVYSFYSYLWFSVIFTIAFVARAFWERHKKRNGAEAEANKEDAGDSYYTKADDYEAPEMTLT